MGCLHKVSHILFGWPYCVTAYLLLKRVSIGKWWEVWELWLALYLIWACVEVKFRAIFTVPPELMSQGVSSFKRLLLLPAHCQDSHRAVALSPFIYLGRLWQGGRRSLWSINERAEGYCAWRHWTLPRRSADNHFHTPGDNSSHIAQMLRPLLKPAEPAITLVGPWRLSRPLGSASWGRITFYPNNSRSLFFFP